MNYLPIFLIICFFGVSLGKNPWEAAGRPDWPEWFDIHSSFVETTRNRSDSINVVFFGDSITQGFGGGFIPGNSVWNYTYAPLGAVNYGIGGDRIENVLYRIINGEVDGLKPKLVVLKIGTNNWDDSTDDIARGIQTIVETLRTLLPKTKILLLGVLPRGEEEWFIRVADINLKISRLDNGETVRFLDMWHAFGWVFGQVNLDLYEPDKVHLNWWGYDKWATTMSRLFNEMYNS